MSLFKTLTVVICSVIGPMLSAPVLGQNSITEPESGDETQAAPGWIAGIAYLSAPDPYVGAVDDASTLVPLIGYVGERLTWIGPSIEYALVDSDDFKLSLSAGYRFEGFDSDSVLATELERRQGSLDMGFSADYGPFTLSASTDVSGTHNGSQATLGVSHGLKLTERLSVSSDLAGIYKNARLSNYYYGVSAAEATSARRAYTPGSAVNVRAGIELTYAINSRVLLNLGVDVERLDRSLRDSPIVNDGTQWSALMGVIFDIF